MEHFLQRSSGGEHGEVIVIDFLGRGPEDAGGDLVHDPCGAGFCGFQVVVGKRFPLVDGDVCLGGAQGEITGCGDYGVPVSDGEGVERELQVHPAVIDGFSFLFTGENRRAIRSEVRRKNRWGQ